MSEIKASVVKHEVNKYPAESLEDTVDDVKSQEDVIEPQQAAVLQNGHLHKGRNGSEDVVDQPTTAAPVKLPKFLLKPDKQGAYCHT